MRQIRHVHMYYMYTVLIYFKTFYIINELLLIFFRNQLEISVPTCTLLYNKKKKIIKKANSK